MTLPQFTAERSLYRSRNVYRDVGGGEPWSATDVVVPATCHWVCNFEGHCGWDCSQPGSGGGGPPARCYPSCGVHQECCGSPSGTFCANILTDSANCGACGYPCEVFGGGTCCNGRCCTGTCCNGACVQTPTDPNNCGGCGITCGAGEVCCNGACFAVSDFQTDNANCGACGTVCAPGQTCQNGSCACTTVAAPGAGLTSNSNYIMDSACGNITGLTMAVNLTEDLTSNSGFSIQLNAFSPSGTTAAQQYVFLVSGNSISGRINNWKSDLSTQIVCSDIGLCSTPLNNGIPAGWTLTMTLNTDSGANVTGATYNVVDNTGTVRANQTFNVSSATCDCTGTCTGFRSGDLSPISAFQVDIVGLMGGASTTFDSGAGTITYNLASGQQLTALSAPPTCIETSFGTVETSNAAYGTLGSCPSASQAQTFSIPTTGTKTCFSTNGPCTGAGGSDQCITINGVTQCCHSNWLWGWFPWIDACTDGTVKSQGCGGPCW